MSNTEVTIRNFTPLADVLVQKYGVMTAAVYGRVHRYTRMSSHVCYASLQSIAEGLNIDRVTVMRHLAILVEDGYLEDLTPNTRNRPHIYKPTRKLVWTLDLGVAEGDSAVAESNSGVAQSNSGVAESHLKKVLRKK